MDEVVIPFLDPSEHYRPEKKFQRAKEEFRDFSRIPIKHIRDRVQKTYMDMHTHQTVEFVRRKLDYWTRFDKGEMTVMEALDKLNCLVDESDPDVDIPNIVHAFQTAERIRKDFPSEEWFQLTGLIHDLGKVMILYGEEQWAVVGDTFPVGCAVAPSVVYHDTTFVNNTDLKDPRYNSRLGMYEEHCGLDNVIMSWGHDEYLYRVLQHHSPCRLPSEALYIIRFHSFYPYHASADYGHLADARDEAMLPWLQMFRNYDLYTKADDMPDVEALVPYYQNLIDKYLPGRIQW